MNKSTFFTGQPIFNQLLNFIPKAIVANSASKHGSDYYCKRFSTYDHLVTMLYCVYNQCTSLREVSSGMLAWEHRIRHLGLTFHPRRSTISDANARRNSDVFESIYLGLLHRYSGFISDSRSVKSKKRKLFIFDSTTISLFQEILKGAGISNQFSGKRKGGIKVHTLVRSDHDVPCMVNFSSAVANDVRFLKHVDLPKGSVLVIDRGYPDYASYNRFTNQGVSWVTRLRKNAIYSTTQVNEVIALNKKRGVIEDKQILLGHNQPKGGIKVKARLIVFKDPESGKIFEFITNDQKCSPLTISQYYKKRWQIELLFKRLKQNFPLTYFLGDNENAIKIQIWTTLIADLILQIIKKSSQCKWAYSNLVSMVRLHMMTYLNLIDFLKAPEKALRIKFLSLENPVTNLSLFPT
jgi:hypothetical protein